MVAIALASVTMSGLASGAVPDGNRLLGACQAVVKYMDGDKSTNSYDFGYCVGIVEATEGSLIILDEALSRDYKTCFPSDPTSNGQKARIVVKFLQENPALLNKPATYLAMLAYKSAYPCK